MSSNTPEPTPPKWIQKLQESSWELEFLISGGAIFSLVQASGFFADAVQSLKITAWLPGTDVFLLLGVLGIQVLTLGFGLHLLLRALWVALVCVTYLYPQGARPERVRWRRPFRAVPPDESYFHNQLLKLNRVCATVMFLAIISTLLLGGLMVLVGVLVTLPTIVVGIHWGGWFDSYLLTLLVLLVLYVIDMVLFGALRRTPVLVWMLFPAFWLFDRLSLRVVLQPALWLFASHVSRLRVAGLLTVFMGLALAYSYAVIYHDLRLPNVFDRRNYREKLAPGPVLRYGFYQDELDGHRPQGATLASKYADKGFVEVFLPYRKQYDEDMAEVDSARYLSDLVALSIDDSLYQRVAGYATYKATNEQMGITAVVPVNHLAVGPHQLLLISRADTARRQVIPFWKTE